MPPDYVLAMSLLHTDVAPHVEFHSIKPTTTMANPPLNQPRLQCIEHLVVDLHVLLDAAALPRIYADQVENLIKFCPTKEKMELLKLEEANYHLWIFMILMGQQMTVLFAEENRKKPSDMRLRERRSAVLNLFSSHDGAHRETKSHPCLWIKGRKPYSTVRGLKQEKGPSSNSASREKWFSKSKEFSALLHGLAVVVLGRSLSCFCPLLDYRHSTLYSINRDEATWGSYDGSIIDGVYGLSRI
ncbi:hypothetical protein Tco_0260809 [Tanacetum coccineum]